MDGVWAFTFRGSARLRNSEGELPTVDSAFYESTQRVRAIYQEGSMSALAELLGIEEQDEGNLVLLRTRDGFEKRMVVPDEYANFGEIKVPHAVSDRALHLGERSYSENVTYTFRRFCRTGIEEEGVEVWEEQ
jgi:hypothetical protein